MKAAFITTVYNEETNIKKLLDSLLVQTVLPAEVIIVDAGSKDSTRDIVQRYAPRFSTGVLRLIKKNGNRSVGRNVAIKNANSEIIAASDAGCILDKNWFETITRHLENKKIDVVAGFYKPITKNTFQKALAAYTCVMSDKVTKDFLPSSRSIAFRKSAWEKVGGYPEELDYCEDLVFASRLKKRGFRFLVEKRAIVEWPQRDNLLEAFLQFFRYAKGDGQALYIRTNTYLLIARYVLGVFLVLLSFIYVSIVGVIFMLLICYFVWAFFKNYNYVKSVSAIIWLPLLQLTSDVAVFTGTVVGLMQRRWDTKI